MFAAHRQFEQAQRDNPDPAKYALVCFCLLVILHICPTARCDVAVHSLLYLRSMFPALAVGFEDLVKRLKEKDRANEVIQKILEVSLVVASMPVAVHCSLE